jgi:hypothetical protein
LVINGQTSREAIRAVGARVAALTAEHASSAARVTLVISEVDMHDGSAEVPRPSFNRQGLNVVIAHAKDRKYDGLSIVPQTLYQKTRFQYFK